MVLPSLRLASILGYFSSRITKIIVDSMGHDGSDYRTKLDHGLTGGVLLYALTTGCYLDLRRRGVDIRFVESSFSLFLLLFVSVVSVAACGPKGREFNAPVAQ